MTKIIMGGRGVGKTARLIKESAETGFYILVANSVRAKHLADQAESMGIHNMPFPVTVEEYFDGRKFEGSSIRRDGMYIDDVDDVVKRVFNHIPIRGVTFTIDPEDDFEFAVKPWPKTNPYLKGDW